MKAPSIEAGGGRLFHPLTSGLRDSVAAAVLLSAAAHAGAIAWGLSGTAERTMAVDAGATTVFEVALVEGPADGAAGGAGSPARPVPIANAEPVVEKAVTPDAAAEPAPDAPEAHPAADRTLSTDRPSPEPAEMTNRALPPAPDAAPVPPPKPDAQAEPLGETAKAEPPATPVKAAPQLAALPDAGPVGRPATEAMMPDPRPSNDPAGSGGAPGARGGGTEGAAPHADNPAPAYPFAARRRGEEGRVVLRVEVLPTGDAGAVTVERSSGVASLDLAAAEAVRRWRFHPARRDGAPVRATVQVPVRFALK